MVWWWQSCKASSCFHWIWWRYKSKIVSEMWHSISVQLIFMHNFSSLRLQKGNTLKHLVTTTWNPCLLTVLLQFGKAVVTHSCWLVLQILQVVLIGGACLTHHLSDTRVTVVRTGFIKSGVVWVEVVRVVQTFPQARQWCLLQVRVNSQVQIMHMVALRSGIQMGAFEPNGAPLSTTHSAWIERDWRLPWRHSGGFDVQTHSCTDW